MRDRKRYGKQRTKGDWVLIDDRSGFKIGSDEAVFDEENPNVITTKDKADPLDIFDLPRVFNPNELGPLPFSRPEQDPAFQADYTWSSTLKTWVIDGVTWDTDDDLWGADSGNWEND